MEFFFNAVRGHQGGREFYTATVPFKMLKRLMSFDTGDVLDRSQRNVDPARAKALATYLVENPTSFVLPALTGIVEDPEMRFEEFGETGSGVGRLNLSLDAVIKLFDGQHRATGIMQALRDNAGLQVNSITIQLFKDMSLEERQQAFSDINANAKAVSASLNMTYNRRNEVVNALTKEVAKVVAWKGMIDHERNVPGKASTALFSFRHVITASRLVIGIGNKSTMTSLEAVTISDVNFWWNGIAPIVEWDAVSRVVAGESVSDAERNRLNAVMANSVAFTAAGLMALARVYPAIKARRGNNFAMHKVLDALRQIDWSKSNDMWSGNLVDSKGNMTSTTAAQVAAAEAITDRVCAYLDHM